MSLLSQSKKTRAAVNRANAQKSTGPKTESGKAASSQNAFKHGIYSKHVVIPGEDPAAFEALRSDLVAEHCPCTVTEELLVDELANHYWRMKRYRNLEAQMYQAKGINEDGSTALDVANLVRCIDLKLFTSVQRGLNSAERGFYKALNTLRELQKVRGFVPSGARAAASAAAASSSRPAAFPVEQRTAAREWAEIQAATGMNQAQLMAKFGKSA